MKTKITLIGSGNVAHNLGLALLKAECEIVEVWSRTITNAKILADKLEANYTDNLANLNKNSDLYIIATTDNAIAKTAAKLDLGAKLIVHTSGSVEINVLEKASSNFGSFYPLQTFTKSHLTDFSSLPICIEGSTSANLNLLQELAGKLTNRVVELTSEQRQKLHLSAVFVSNFANYMQVIGEELCREQQVDFGLLKPLIEEVFEKNKHQKAIDNQTGPALRGDTFTMNKHLELLSDNKEWRELYQMISGMIQNSKSINQ